MNTAKDAGLRPEARGRQAGRTAVQRPEGRTKPGTVQARNEGWGALPSMEEEERRREMSHTAGVGPVGLETVWIPFEM